MKGIGVDMPEHPSVPRVRHVTSVDIPSIREILFAALNEGELRGTTPRDLEHLLERVALDASGKLVSMAGDGLVGFFDPEYPLLVVDPRHRRQRHGTRLVERALVDAREGGLHEVELAPPLGDGPAEAFAASVGFAYRSSLWQLRLAQDVAVPPPRFPAGYDARPFQPGADDEAYLTLVNVSFEDHPSPMHLSLDIMQYVHARPGFDPHNIAVVPAPEGSGRLVAFCRAHPADLGGENKAEIGTLGVLPEYRGL
ncbi:MAG TPA: GNAT family N-acetyltransferase, partial [Thermomicrobiales bacterium]|nr:GNAT family N-acetyltransferase [Thermomicrobiales bacterium]